ncbi:hypothetical protein H9660_15275 [Clostridium sp. Sa3CUN1]|uniref:Uncharacterized protein n=1 Tax=Clostridium gallinarum TaxID=2762246 RepID=A0ABR8Q7U9_9CLOT|nr:hypothetical protein [Clostridium gallinarum]MBD7916505.1 hypothetical protein [Clostridium gallinarum]
MKDTFKNLDIFNLNYLNSIEEPIYSYNLKDDILYLYFQNIYFDDICDISVFLENIKTREIYKCNSSKEKNLLKVYLSTLNYLCTDYEYSIYIILNSLNCYKIIYPKCCVTYDKISNPSLISKSNKIKWYLRIEKNGYFRLSTIYLF